ncbi:hypothetical protein HBH56_128980 [Parastagonospora nodorum]|nr:hypothetical protein HBH56_128980 [Parastagonospora nodorum]KAH4135103.1 hypothetical protein HBH45_154530 [Parastagonospora nodorum]KAH4189856.1 hypothetical protein HBH42_136730 [Parastagonospora nodorum]KAH4221897.1 hypothetical protein HBI06_153450 [Parastagonospora nodorum]KAH4239377.1 hypothetical protein HBI05_115830 [Parastagonospora nodorum]
MSHTSIKRHLHIVANLECLHQYQSVERETLRFHFLRKRLIQSQGCGFDPRIGLDDSFFALFLIILGVGLELVIGQQQS